MSNAKSLTSQEKPTETDKKINVFPNNFEVDHLLPCAIENGITIGAIAKNESRYIVEWLAYHLAIGVNRILVYSNDSEDDQARKLESISRHDHRVSWIDKPSVSGESPQISAYNESLRRATTPWISFIDIDEFLVPTEDATIHEYLATIPPDVSSVHVNWRGFGSGGRKTEDYELVTRAFMWASPVRWGNNHHFKSIARTKFATEAHIHNIATSEGRRTLSNFNEFETINGGLADEIVYHRIQINHYQCKTYFEFVSRMQRGAANFPLGHPERERDDSKQRFQQLDLNDEINDSILRFNEKLISEYEVLTV
jgi:hypothetical protein